jgi:plasmid maintenance system antidote protein VapI
MAVRISKVIGGTPESWLHMQEAVDLWEVEQKFISNPAIAPIPMKPLLATI